GGTRPQQRRRIGGGETGPSAPTARTREGVAATCEGVRRPVDALMPKEQAAGIHLRKQPRQIREHDGDRLVLRPAGEMRGARARAIGGEHGGRALTTVERRPVDRDRTGAAAEVRQPRRPERLAEVEEELQDRTHHQLRTRAPFALRQRRYEFDGPDASTPSGSVAIAARAESAR